MRHDVLLPAFVVEHDGRLVLLTLKPFHNLVGLLTHLLVYILALLVVLIDMGSLGQRTLEVAFNQEIDRLGTVLYSTGGIDARTYAESNLTHGDLASGKSANLND